MSPAYIIARSLPLPDWSELERQRVAKRLLEALTEAGYEVVRPTTLHETSRVYGGSA